MINNYEVEELLKSYDILSIVLQKIIAFLKNIHETRSSTIKKTYKYKAFISYSHQDQKFAKWLHKKIENYKIPKSLREKYPNLPKDLKRTIFLDDEELPTAAALPDNLSHALESSELLIVVCSPSASQSYWVDKEIAYFKQYHGEGKILAILKEGEPNATYSSLYETTQEAFPKSLRYAIDSNGELTNERAEPLAADARKRSHKKKALLKLIAGILKVDFADLWERDRKETRKRRSIIGLIFILFIALSIYASVQFLGEQGNKELEQITTRIATIEYSIRHDDLPVEKVIALNVELKKLKKDKENREDSQKALGKLKTSLGKKAEIVYKKEGAKPAIKILTSRKTLANQDARLKDVSKEKLATAKLFVEMYKFNEAEKYYKQATEIFFDYENANEYGAFLQMQDNFGSAIHIYKQLLKGKISAERIANTLSNLGGLYTITNQYKKAENRVIESLKIFRVLVKKNPDVYNPVFATSLIKLGELYRYTNQYKEAEERYIESLKIFRVLVKKNPDVYNLALATSLIGLGGLYMDINQYKKAENRIIESLKIFRVLVKKNPDAYNLVFATSLVELGELYRYTNQYKKAREIYIEPLKIFRILVKKNPDAYNSYLAISLLALGELYMDTNQYKEAEERYIESLKIFRVLVKKNPDVYNPVFATSLNNLGSLYTQIKQFNNAKKLYMEALEIYRKLLKINSLKYKEKFNIILTNLNSLR